VAIRLLDNSAWGFESSCFVCEPTNPKGLGVAFFSDDVERLVFADLRLGPEHSGAPTYLHGGVVSAVLDEAMAWAAIAIAGRFALTRHLTVRFDRPARVDRDYRVEAKVVDESEDLVRAAATFAKPDGKLCAEARAELTVVSSAQAADAAGTAIAEELRGYVRG
jgi:uncharacterized protein (TIGR00369 family)